MAVVPKRQTQDKPPVVMSEPAASQANQGLAPLPEPSVELATPEPVEETSDIAETQRKLKRSNAISDLLAAHQKISMDEIYADQFRAFISAETDPAEIAKLQDDLSEIRNDIRDAKAMTSKLEADIESLSKDGDADYELPLATYLADLAEDRNVVARAKRAGVPEIKELEEALEKMHRADLQEVLEGKHARVSNR